MRVKYVLKSPDGSGEPEVLVDRDAAEYPVPSVGDRVRVDSAFFRVWDVFHAFDVEEFGGDEVHVLVEPRDGFTGRVDWRTTGWPGRE